uniref:Uncharacterized protein n=1 Tax=Pyxicephalus adspersus TaxID=30357 RepID=A0AAV3BAN6_PYXAD|nr:TPA: hypothetical protein GDO54_001215 [Pyxicephalus adspersus]
MTESVILSLTTLHSREMNEGSIRQVQYQILPISNTQAKRKTLPFMQNQRRYVQHRKTDSTRMRTLMKEVYLK